MPLSYPRKRTEAVNVPRDDFGYVSSWRILKAMVSIYSVLSFVVGLDGMPRHWREVVLGQRVGNGTE